VRTANPNANTYCHRNNEHHTNVNRLGNGNGHRDLHGISYTYCITVTYTNV